MVRYTTDSFIEKAIAIHGTKYDYSKTIYVAYKEKLKIICLTKNIVIILTKKLVRNQIIKL